LPADVSVGTRANIHRSSRIAEPPKWRAGVVRPRHRAIDRWV
jgi:hypothetical protein